MFSGPIPVFSARIQTFGQLLAFCLSYENEAALHFEKFKQTNY